MWFYVKERSNRLFSIPFLSLSAEQSVFNAGRIQDSQVNADWYDWLMVLFIKIEDGHRCDVLWVIWVKNV